MLKSMLAPSPELLQNFARSDRKKSVAVAVVGCGYWGSKHVRVLSSMAQVSHVYAVDGDPKIRQQIASEYLNTTAVEDLSQVLDYVDGVVVATPSQYHAEVAIQALSAGKGVLIEKPIATSLRDAERIRETARLNGAVLVAGHTYEFNPILHDLKRRIDAGELGEIRYLHSARLNMGPYRSDVSVVWDLAPHDISIMNYLMGENSQPGSCLGCLLCGPGHSRHRAIPAGVSDEGRDRNLRQLVDRSPPRPAADRCWKREDGRLRRSLRREAENLRLPCPAAERLRRSQVSARAGTGRLLQG